MGGARWFSILSAVLAASLPGCGDDGGGDAPRCATELALGVELDLEPTGGPTQIHANLAFDGSRLWLAYNLPDGEGAGGFDSFVRRFDCDGTPVGDAVRVTTTAGTNDVDPSLALGDVVGVVWNADDNTGFDNLDVVYRGLDYDGAPIDDSDRVLATTHDGQPVTGNVLSPVVAALPDGELAVAAVRGLDETNSFQAFVQRIDADGELLGEAIDARIEANVTHMSPTLAASADGDLYLAYTRSAVQDESFVAHTRIAAGAEAVDPAPPAELPEMSGGASYAVAGDGTVLLARHSAGADRDIVLGFGDRFAASAPQVSFGVQGRSDHTPVIAVGPERSGVVAYYRNIAGLRNDVVLQPFTWEGDELALGAERVLDVGPAAPYAPAITYVQDGAYAVAWSEGTSPDFYVKGLLLQP